MLMSIRRPASGLLAAAAVLLAACGGTAGSPDADVTATGDGQAATGPSGTTPTTPAATTAASPADEPSPTPATGSTERAAQDGSGDPVTVTDIEVTGTDGVDRIVLHTSGGGTPGWVVQYVDRAQQQGSGEEVEVAGEAILEVLVTNSGYPFDTGEEEFSGDVDTADADVVADVTFEGVYEGQAQLFIGLDARHPFQVSSQEGPSRIVIEIAYG